MILPVPYPETIYFEESLLQYKELFSDLSASLFNTGPTTNPNLTRSLGTTVKTTLPVLSVGSYRVSICTSIEDLKRLDTSLFPLSQSLLNLLRSQYGPTAKKIPFGFLCCRLKSGVREYSHIAYSHKAPSSNTLFLPTKHFHGEDVREEHWDHKIYSLHCGLEASNSSWIPKPKNFLELKYFPSNIPLTPITQVCLWEKKGLYKNEDLEFRFNTAILLHTEPKQEAEPQSVISKIKSILATKNCLL
jgi:hypothetical protein